MITPAQHVIARRPLIALLRDIPIAGFLQNPETEGARQVRECAHRHDAPDLELVTDCTLPRWTRRSREEVMEAVAHMVAQIEPLHLPKSIFSLLPQVSAEYLLVRDGSVRVKRKHYLRWRDLALHLDGDLFVVAALAQQDVHRQWLHTRRQFDWPEVFLPDDPRFEALFRRGVADNHTHLDALGPVFQPAWISLMNDVKGRYPDFEKAGLIDKHLAGEIHPRPTWMRFSLYHQVLDAAALRLVFWQAVMAQDGSAHAGKFDYIDGFLTTSSLLPTETHRLQAQISSIHMTTRMDGIHLQGSKQAVDYASIHFAIPDPEVPLHIDAGERWLLYRLLRGIYLQEEWALALADRLYRYLVIKNRFRKELIQVNERIGFGNFYSYQDRKDIFAQATEIKRHRYQPVMTIGQQHFGINHQDLRFKPKPDYSGLADKLQKIAALVGRPSLAGESTPTVSVAAHFIKEKDQGTTQAQPMHPNDWIAPRHTALRREVKGQSLAILHLRQIRHALAGMIQAIDAANNELNCRPEVFAQAYRALRAHEMPPESPVREHMRASLANAKNSRSALDQMFKEPLPTAVPTAGPLRIKHHAGEEFLDLVDGLRYLDEAIHFLDLQRGDYLGHALAAGLDVRHWYGLKSNKIYLSKQDALDNYVWLANVTIRYGIAVNSTLRSGWERQIHRLLEEILKGALSDEEIDRIGAATLYEAWKLRGDDPGLYRTLDCIELDNRTIWRRHALNDSELCRDADRKSRTVRQLYHLYHYSRAVRLAGRERCAVQYKPEEIDIIEQVQTAIRNQIAHLGLFVETLPTINVLIGEIKYESHPIFRFFPVRMSELPSGHLPLHVSVNPDNPGVINSNATAELAMLMVALDKRRDASGQRMYNDEEIYAWLERVRQMGEEQRILPGISISGAGAT